MLVNSWVAWRKIDFSTVGVGIRDRFFWFGSFSLWPHETRTRRAIYRLAINCKEGLTALFNAKDTHGPGNR